MHVNEVLLTIARIDRELAGYVASKKVIALRDPHISSLKQARRLNVTMLQNYKPRG
jgi:hypothetical protein